MSWNSRLEMSLSDNAFKKCKEPKNGVRFIQSPHNKIQFKMSMNILALDIATKTGWKTASASGTWDLKPNRGETEGMRVVRFKSKVRELIEAEQITLIAYERPAGMHKASIMVASEMVGVLKDLCIERGVQLACYSATEIKKFATGKGNANKDAMIAAAVQFGFNPKDDNEADAIHLYRLTVNELL